ncbi:MAG: YbdK family carboxylate-amine ligase [Thermoleophilia bacterium]|nr:YbdK family carboxylate-amine ligase [Thermoleophilia bacterium]
MIARMTASTTSDSSTPPFAVDAEQLVQLDGVRARFDDSTDGTLGIEEEFAICDPDSLDLQPRYEELRAAAEAVGLEREVAGELLASEIEFRTGRCVTWSDAVRELTDIRQRVMGAARSVDAVLAASGTHPWADYREQTTVPLPYYEALVERMRFVAQRNNTFGLHVHVGVHGADRAIRVHDALRSVAPLLLALSGSSPFLDGLDTGFASARSVIFSRAFPRANVAPIFGTLDAYLDHLRWLLHTGTISTTGQVWWSTRPHVLHGTIELRMFDGQPDVRDTLALAALASGTIAHLAALDDAGELPPPVATELIDENAWRAARYGTDAVFVDTPSARLVCADEAIGVLIANARRASDAQQLGLDAGLDRAQQLLEAGASGLWQRELYETAGHDLRVAYRGVIDATMSSANEPALV